MMIDWGALLHDTAPAAHEPAPPSAERTGSGLPAVPRCTDAQTRDDDRRPCTACGNLAAHGLCLAASRSEIVASRGYTPIRDLLRRCEGFQPLPGDLDQRPGRARWPWLVSDDHGREERVIGVVGGGRHDAE